MPTRDPLRVQRGCLADQVRLLAGAAPTSTLWDGHGLLAAHVPAAPQRSTATATTRPSADALARLATAYRHALGPRSLRLAAPSAADRPVLARAGYRPGRELIGMLLSLTPAPELPPAGDLRHHQADVATLGAVNAGAHPPGAGHEHALVHAPEALAVRVYAARLADTIACVLATVDHEHPDGADCGVHYVATLPAARGRGLATRLLAVALREAGARGCVSASLQASPAGAALYRRLGFADACAVTCYEHAADHA